MGEVSKKWETRDRIGFRTNPGGLLLSGKSEVLAPP